MWHAWFWAQRAPQSTFSIQRLSQSWTALSCPLPQSFSVSLASTMLSFAYSSHAGWFVSYHSNGKIKFCRDGALCLLKRGWPSAKLLCQLDSQPVGLLRREKNIIIACMDQTLMCLTNKVSLLHSLYPTYPLCVTQGKRVWQQKLPSAICCIEQMEIPSRGLSLIAVALSSSHLLIFDDKNVVDCFQMDNPVSAMKFGKFGREDNTLVLVTVRHFHLNVCKVDIPPF